MIVLCACWQSHGSHSPWELEYSWDRPGSNFLKDTPLPVASDLQLCTHPDFYLFSMHPRCHMDFIIKFILLGRYKILAKKSEYLELFQVVHRTDILSQESGSILSFPGGHCPWKPAQQKVGTICFDLFEKEWKTLKLWISLQKNPCVWAYSSGENLLWIFFPQ